jgi:hypothetical protein
MKRDKGDTDIEGLDSESDVIIPVDYRRFNRNLLILLISIEIALVIIDATVNYQGFISVAGLRRMANIAREDGIGTWFMSVQTLLAGTTILMIYLASRRKDDPRRTSLSWLALSLFFFFMAADDAAQIHERLGSAFKYYAETGAGLSGRILDIFPSYPWQLILLPFFVGFGVFMLFFVWKRINSNEGRAKLILALACFAAALLIDFIEGLEPDHSLNIFYSIIDNTTLGEDFVRHFAKVIEEFLEMLGITLLLSMFFIYLAEFVDSIGIGFVRGEKEE